MVRGPPARDGGDGGTFDPAELDFVASADPQVFTYLPDSVGVKAEPLIPLPWLQVSEATSLPPTVIARLSSAVPVKV